MTTDLVPNTPNQQGFNKTYKKTWTSVDEKTFLQGVMRTDSERAFQYFGVGTILHNIAVNLRDPHFEEDVNEIHDVHETAEYVRPQSHRGVVARDYIANTYF